MTVQACVKSAGYENFQQVAQRIAMSCAVLMVATLIGRLCSRNFDARSHLFFSLVEATSFNLVIHNEYFSKIEGMLKELEPQNEDRMKKIANIAQFILLCSLSLLPAKVLTSKLCREVSYFRMVMGGVVFNGTVGVAGIYLLSAL